ncbi:MAG: polyphosphate polymerase domain-containing protein, partial [Bacillota bacterium]
TASAPPQPKTREESVQAAPSYAVSAKPQVTMREEPRAEARTVSPQPQAAPDTRQTRKPSIRDVYVPKEAAELDIFNDSSRRKDERVRGSAMASMRVQRTEFEEFYEPAQGVDSAPAFRHELKYYINYAEYILLRNTLKALAQIDKYAGENGEYFIRSLYFDDEYESALNEKLGGSDYRKKYRIRIYNFSDDVIKFEKKIKQGQFITKKSISLSRDEYERITAGEYAFLLRRKEPFAQELYLELRSNRLRPRVIVDYIREAYVYPFENIRITFDKELRSGMWLSPDIFDPNLPTMPMYEEGMLVLEVKFEKSLPAHIRGVLGNIQAAQHSAISKYVICRKFE